MRVLVLGSGGREHAIVRSLISSAHAPEVVCAPGNGGTAADARNVALDIEEPEGVAAFAAEAGFDLVVIGPEAPLVAGVADALTARGIRAFGPSAAAARLEGSKDYAKDVMSRHGIPTALAASFTDERSALEYLAETGTPVVVKADGLASGKGVTVAMELPDAVMAVRECFSGRFGEAGRRVLIEEYLEGPECSLLAFTDGVTVVPMVPAQDHKRAFDDDMGPNTGGMGVYSPVPAVDDATLARMRGDLERTVAGLAADGVPYRGVLYGGFMLTQQGPKVLEYNARFGDPETQVVLPLLATDLLDVMLAVAEERLADVDVEWLDAAAVSVVLASGGYPGDYAKGKVITGIAEAEAVPGVTVFHAGTTLREDGALVTNGGRVLNVTAVAPTITEARERAYEAASRIAFEGMFMRSDIGLKAMGGGA
ncbi:MAG: phosphoribosylamine--glycine ligase [Actinobacteria bacterium]|nr:MAG: phosphoribosylamine--glycine ligase [Actinomycetota bacterium]